tara:strand:- start:240 stop:653 length:414 start_codon:yes stop_codon:yes gene_type:complete
MKECTRCNQEKELTEFHKKGVSPDGYQTLCKECRSDHFKRDYTDRKEMYLDKNNKRRDKWRYYINSFKTGCTQCDEKVPQVLDFHHIDPKTKLIDIPTMLSESFNEHHKTRFLDEIAKCVLVCANCHRKIHLGILKI